MKSIFTLFILVPILSSYSYGQHKEAHQGISELDEKYIAEKNYKQIYAELEGTFQLHYNVSGMKPLMEKSILAKVANMRMQSQHVFLTLSQNVTLFVPSYDAINAPGFVPLETEKYVGTGNSAFENQ